MIVGAGALLAAMAAYWVLGSSGGFLGHMGVHVVNLAVAAPLVGFACAERWPFGGEGRFDLLNAPLTAAMLELIVVWFWHTPSAHGLARAHGLVFVIEQVTLFSVGLLLWAPSLAALRRAQQGRIAGSVLAFLLTSMHMTVLGAILLFSKRVLFDAGPGFAHNFRGQPPLDDQHAGATVMLALLGALYLVAALRFMAALLDTGEKARGPGRGAEPSRPSTVTRPTTTGYTRHAN